MKSRVVKRMLSGEASGPDGERSPVPKREDISAARGNVRVALVVILGVALSGAAYGQAGNDPEQCIKQVINTGMIEGLDQKLLVHLGDAGAVIATKVLADTKLTPKTIGGALMVLENSFAEPKLVEITADREPRTSLLLLRYLELSTSDAESRKNIVDTRKYVQERYATFRKASEQ